MMRTLWVRTKGYMKLHMLTLDDVLFLHYELTSDPLYFTL